MSNVTSSMYVTKFAGLAAAAVAALAGSAHAGFMYTSSLRGISLTTPAGTSGASTTDLGTWFDVRNYAFAGLSGTVQQGSALNADDMTFGAYAQLFSSNAGFSGPLGATSASDVAFMVDVDTIATLSVATWAQAFGSGAAANVSVILRDMTGGTTLFESFTGQSTAADFTFIAGRVYSIDVMNSAAVNAGSGNAFTNYSVSITAVPAPGALALLGAAGLAAGLRRRR